MKFIIIEIYNLIYEIYFYLREFIKFLKFNLSIINLIILKKKNRSDRDPFDNSSDKTKHLEIMSCSVFN